MSLKRKLEGEVEIREGAADAFHDIYKTKPHHVSQAASHFVHSVEMDHGVAGEVGSIVSWIYTLDGKRRTIKTVFEEIDEQKKLVRQRATEGDLLDLYKSLVFICHVEPKDKENSIVKWILEYEKVHPGIPEPSSMMDALLATAKDIDDHHHGIKK